MAAPMMRPFTKRPSSAPTDEISMRSHAPYGIDQEAETLLGTAANGS